MNAAVTVRTNRLEREKRQQEWEEQRRRADEQARLRLQEDNRINRLLEHVFELASEPENSCFPNNGLLSIQREAKGLFGKGGR